MPTTVPLTTTTTSFSSSSSSSTQPSLLGKLARLFSRATRILLYKLTSFSSSSGSRTRTGTDPESSASSTSLLKVGKMPGYSSSEVGQSSSSSSNQELDKTTTTMINTMSKQKSFRTRSSWNSDLDHDKEWERKKNSMQQRTARRKFVGRCSSDCTGMRSSSSIQVVDDHSSNRRAKARSLTDEDLDELRGCIDLGFGGCVDRPDPELWKTFPALELCYAINHNFKQQQQQQQRTSSPPSPQVEQRHDGWPSSSSSSPVLSSQQQRSSFTSDDGTAGRSSTSSRSPDCSRSEVADASCWQISSPGDGPQQVKNRLRHWARAVACTLQQQQQQQQCYAY